MIKVGASILAADCSCLCKEIRRIENAGIDFFHLDIMDGHFVPNITVGPAVVADIRKVTKLPLDVHLMIENPFNWVDKFIASGADMLTLHIETIKPRIFRQKARRLRSKGIKLGISLNPNTPLSRIQSLLGILDFVLVMTVYPGFGGQNFMASVLPKVKALRKIYNKDIAVDGGINDAAARKVITAGANILNCGTYIFKSPNPGKTIRRLKCL